MASTRMTGNLISRLFPKIGPPRSSNPKLLPRISVAQITFCVAQNVEQRWRALLTTNPDVNGDRHGAAFYNASPYLGVAERPRHFTLGAISQMAIAINNYDLLPLKSFTISAILSRTDFEIVLYQILARANFLLFLCVEDELDTTRPKGI
ncbi:hypothetical protein DM860_006522 [Cuscuta australis]|uniref:Uncharacterized protein n=1 Tax=Cuscuta australis TaxID=267555 RepID=A0A328D3Q8_9ASTE|nr:hypothetical protein DM860_006522 [Cuscuta australis]